jgi:hypothetical protein
MTLHSWIAASRFTHVCQAVFTVRVAPTCSSSTNLWNISQTADNVRWSILPGFWDQTLRHTLLEALTPASICPDIWTRTGWAFWNCRDFKHWTPTYARGIWGRYLRRRFCLSGAKLYTGSLTTANSPAKTVACGCQRTAVPHTCAVQLRDRRCRQITWQDDQ